MSGQNMQEIHEKLRKIIAPDRAALMIIDMQNDFVSSKGKMAEFGFYLGSVQETIKPIKSLLQTARALHYPVIHTSMINDVNQNPYSWYAFWGEPAVTLPRSWGAGHIDELKPQKGELTVAKYTYGAFEGTNLNTILRRKGIQTLMLAGTDLNICAGDTLHHAFALGYHVVAVSDCLASFSRIGAAHSEQLHQMGLYIVENHFGTVISSRQLITIMQAPPGVSKSE
jgi:ureidoacrylate peracid hydrolase